MSNIQIPAPSLQLDFYRKLEDLRQTLLLDALLATVKHADIARIDHELGKLPAAKSLNLVASWGLRGEIVFATPYLLQQNPRLLGYYRLLLGFSQKQFYGKECGCGPFKSMEEKGRMSAPQESRLEELCSALSRSADILVRGMHRLDKSMAHELTLLTLGPQLRGGKLNALGGQAVNTIFDLIRSIVEDKVVSASPRAIEIQNAAGRLVRVEFASDPDICIRETLPSGSLRNLVAIEIKGGKDVSNIHNRIGEAEKSHQKARKTGFVECWTIVGVERLEEEIAKKESPSTDRFYTIEGITDVRSSESHDFAENLRSRVSIGD
ncbi:MAG: XcyI family restriction endonuclease [Thermoanaerobaculia bacterium]|nr:XcyI family restriction endonuclease [Thermoanaerobaculia bacterium]